MAITLHAAPVSWDPGTGKPIAGFAYGGSVPGPTVVVKAGDTLRFTLVNDLGEPTTIHWHGMRVPWQQDGVPGETQDPIAAGASYTYEFTVIDPGFYWFHPHTMDSGDMIDLGLQAMVIVRDPAEPSGAAQGIDCDLPLALDDLDLDSGLRPRTNLDEGTLMAGHLGNTLLANGRTDTRIVMHPGGHDLLRIVNTAAARYFDLTMDSHTFKVVGWEGGWLSTPYTTDRLVIAPGERYQVIVEGTGSAGQSYPIVNHTHKTSPTEHDPLGDETIATLMYDDVPSTTASPVFPAAPIPAWTVGTPTHTYILNDAMVGSQWQETIDDGAWPNVPIITFDSALGPRTVAIQNLAFGNHPMHFHGERMLVMERRGIPQTVLGWKDTIDVEPGETVVLMSDFANIGTWMFHCHILDHAMMGMMAEFDATGVIVPAPQNQSGFIRE